MTEITGNIWDYLSVVPIVITTNGSVSKSGSAILGRGLAKQAASKFPEIAKILGKFITASGNHVYYLESGLVSFPVEETAWSQPEAKIIARSAVELSDMVGKRGWKSIIVPRPACGGGGLSWSMVKPLLEPWFDERFIVISEK